MSKFLHRMVRRFIAWANTPTAEEVAAEEQVRAAEIREGRLRRVAAALLREPGPHTYYGLSRDDVETLEADMQSVAAQYDISERRVRAHIEALRKQSGHYPRAA